jgi:hypothetical protein
MKNLSKDSDTQGQDLKPGTPEYAQSQRLVAV